MNPSSLPRSPFSTPLSQSVREVRDRIFHIAQGPKRFPPLWLILPVLLLTLCSGALISCHSHSAPSAPVFTQTSAGEECVPFSDILGFDGTVTRIISKDGSIQYLYRSELGDGTSFLLAECQGLVFHLDLDGDGQLELVEENPDLHQLTVWQRGSDGSIRTLDLQQAAAQWLGLEGVAYALVDLDFHPEEQSVTLSPTSGTSQTLPLTQLLEITRSGRVFLSAQQVPLSGDTKSVFFNGFNLDGRGEADDCVILTSSPNFEEGTGLTTLDITLGTGEHLQWSTSFLGIPAGIFPMYLHSVQRQALVLELDTFGSTYGAAIYLMLQVENGEVSLLAHMGAESLDGVDLSTDYATQSGAFLHTQPNGQQVIRIPTLYDKWHSSIWGTLTWDTDGPVFHSDGYFIDTYPIQDSQGRELTLALHCTVSPISDYETLTYDQVQISDGNQIIQTIDLDSVHPDSSLPFQGFYANNAGFSPVNIQDINFDGAQDFGLNFDLTRNCTRCWFIWDSEAQQFSPSLCLGESLTLYPQEHRLVVEGWDTTTWEPATYTYQYNDQGVLVPTDLD
ncbi:MAG: hypothetical protein ACOX7N_09475 [Lawsonibacter sp.]|jgi:hypothetical protein